MKEKIGVVCFFLFNIAFTCYSQLPFFGATTELFSNRIWDYEQIPIQWTMQGIQQADLNDGLNHLMEQHLLRAETSFTLVIDRDPSVWQAYYFRAATRKMLSKYQHAEVDLQKALQLHGPFYEGYVELAKIYFLKRDQIESDRAIAKAIRMDRAKEAAYEIKADIKLKLGDRRAAIKNYEECLEIDSMFHNARVKVAILKIAAGKEATALKQLNTVLAYDSLQKTALMFRAILGFAKDSAQAVRDLSKLIRVNPGNVEAYLMRGIYCTLMRDYMQGFRDFDHFVTVTTADDNMFRGQQTMLDRKIDIQNVGAYTITRVYGLPDEDAAKIKEAFCHIVIQKFDESIKALDKVSNASKEPLAMYLKAVAYEHKGDHQKALHHYTKALTLDNEIADAHKKRAIYAQELKQWDQSIKDLNELLRLQPATYVSYRIRGVSYYYKSEFDKAVSDFTSYLLKYDSTSSEVLGHRGMAYLQKGENLKAYSDFARSRNTEGIDFEDCGNLLEKLLATGDTTQTLYFLNKMTEALPYFTRAQIIKFRIHHARNHWESIERDIQIVVDMAARNGTPKIHYSYLVTLKGMVHQRAGKREEAKKAFTEAILLDDTNAPAYLERGKLYFEGGSFKQAQSDLQRASFLGSQSAKQLLITIATKK
jgi:tetratricopeptide (TPR) repeat protein